MGLFDQPAVPLPNNAHLAATLLGGGALSHSAAACRDKRSLLRTWTVSVADHDELRLN